MYKKIPMSLLLVWFKYCEEIDEIDLGYRFKKSAWGKGYATEAAKHTLEYGFNVLQLDSITGRAHIENTGSLKVLERIGMGFIKVEMVDDCSVKTYTMTSADFNIHNPFKSI